ncbi:hypothetical protein MalM25_03940 [Planctomycetes bacterium MalM25]|nr:hypothetical protein MalM25_03940 [Planctomycetes bacterium MalM25]
MPSRKKRKRDRRRAEATVPTSTNPQGGWGDVPTLRRGDIQLAVQAVREGWPTREENRVAVSQAICGIVSESEASDRLKLAAARFVIEVYEGQLHQMVRF